MRPWSVLDACDLGDHLDLLTAATRADLDELLVDLLRLAGYPSERCMTG